MAHLTLDQRIFIVKSYYENKSVTDVQRKFKYLFRGTNVSRMNIYKFIRKFEETGSVKNAPKSGDQRTVEVMKTLVRYKCLWKKAQKTL